MSEPILERLDAHLAVANQHMARGNELTISVAEEMARGRELMSSVREEMARGREVMKRLEQRMEFESRTTREFLAEVSARSDLSFREIGDEMRAQTAVLLAHTAEVRESRGEVREGREEQRAQTQALLRMIDRMDRMDSGGAGPPV